ncbi:MAG: hypothetical protein AABW73_00675 [Nanoarchaeota archaeon]
MVKSSTVLLIVLAVTLLLTVSAVRAEVFLEQPAAIYNLGDEITLAATVDSLSDNFFDMSLNCEQNKVVITHDILSSTIVRKSFTLSNSFIGPLKGSCFIAATYGTSSVQSQTFTISDHTDAYAEIDKKEVGPSESIIIRISATKANGKAINGFASVTFAEAGISLDLPVINGVAVYNFSLPQNMASGTYSIKTKVYEKDKQGNIINDANLESNIFVKQEARKIEVSIENQEATPGTPYKFKILVYDQTDKEITTQARYSLLNGEDTKINDQIVNSGEDIMIDLPINETPGYRTIVVKVESLSNKRFFYVPEVEKVTFEIVNTTLKIANTGNVPYKKSVEVGIGPNKEIIDLELGVGESAIYSLQAPDGSYDVSATDGVGKFSASGISLTGNAVRLIDVADSTSIITRYSLVWLFILGVLGLFIFGVSKGLGKQKFIHYMPSLAALSRLVKGNKYGNTNYEAPNISTIRSSDVTIGRVTPKEAEHSLVIRGVKEPCSIIAIKIKNKQKIEKQDYYKTALETIIAQITKVKGSVYQAEEFIIGILAPSATKTYKTENTSLIIAQEIKSVLTLHNSKSNPANKIEFGIGINHGDLVVEIDKQTKKLKFTSLGQTLSLAKKLADGATSEVLLSQQMQRRVASATKVKKIVKGDTEAYELNSVVNRDDNSKFIDSFKARNEYH